MNEEIFTEIRMVQAGLNLSQIWLESEDPGLMAGQAFVDTQNALRLAIALVEGPTIEDRIAKLGIHVPATRRMQEAPKPLCAFCGGNCGQCG